jgi:purine-binding chemotaxis protein CheW
MEMLESVTRVPNAAPFVDGVVFSRGRVVPAVNLRARFGFERAPYDLRTRLIVVGAEGRSVGLVADDGREFLRLPSSAIQAPQDTLAGLSGEYVEGVASVNGRLILVLKLDNLLNFSEPLVAA